MFGTLGYRKPTVRFPICRSWLGARGAAVVAVVFLLLSACGNDAESNKVPRPEVIDNTDTVEDSAFHHDMKASFSAYDKLGRDGVGVVDAPEGWDLRVVWMANACRKAPHVEVNGSDAVSTVVIDPGPKVSDPDVGGQQTCPAMSVPHGVDLHTSTPPAADVQVTLQRETD